MKNIRLISLLILAFVLPCTGTALAQVTGKRPLDHSVYDGWNTIQGEALSPDGRWVMYTLAPQDGGDVTLIVKSLNSDSEFKITQGTAARFTDDSQFVLFLIEPTEEEVKQAKKEKKETDEQPKNQLGILDLANSRLDRIDHIKSFRVPEKAAGWIAYLKEKPLESEEMGEEVESESGEQKKKKEPGTDLVLRNLRNGEETSYRHTISYTFSANGRLLIYSTSAPEGEPDGIYAVNTRSRDSSPVLIGNGDYKAITIAEDNDQVAFLSNRDDYEADQSAYSLYHWKIRSPQAATVATEASPGIPGAWWISEYGSLSFSRDGTRLFFGTAPRPEPEVEQDEKEEESEESEVVLDIWHWKDTRLQPQQILETDRDRRRNYRAVVHLGDGLIVQLADEEIPTVNIGDEGNADTGLAVTNVPYLNPVSWEYPGLSDVHLVDVNTGERELILEGVQVSVTQSPTGRYLVWWDYRNGNWISYDILNGFEVDLSADIPNPVYNEIHDTPSPAPGYGNAGWTRDDDLFLIYDRFDIWATDPSGRTTPRNITEGIGREQKLRFRYVRIDPEEEHINPGELLLLTAFDDVTKASGFYRDRVRGNQKPEKLIMMDYSFSRPVKAEDANVVLFTRESFLEFPDLWVSDSRLSEMEKVSYANPQQEEYLWGRAELVHWRSVDGVPLQGILYKPEEFDPSNRYPMMVTFYEKNSDNLHRHWMPEPHRSIINYTFYTSRGYLVFLPDIPYRIGYPGESALNAVIPGVNTLIHRGFVDAENIGVAGHSWGGYQIAFMITRTNLFKAAEAGAPVSNMTSAYGGIRWASGLSRMFQYEWTQSRIGATLWEAPLKYIENSPLFWADKIETPLLIMHNDEDGAVPWEQGIELFVALRRLQKPVWMITYNKQPHWPITWPNKKDWAVRLQQYFDHFLKGVPAPLWISEGVPALEKGKTLGRELPPG